ncbi:MAG TPA: translation initiation factor IF-2 [Methylomirabilota bacterium]|nr:translation initiation factor IF-2 [Methylomirabilota bacterium]
MRVHELAKELAVTSKELIRALDAIEITGKSAQSSLDKAQITKVRSHFAKGQSSSTLPKGDAKASAKPAAKELTEKKGVVKKVKGVTEPSVEEKPQIEEKPVPLKKEPKGKPKAEKAKGKVIPFRPREAEEGERLPAAPAASVVMPPTQVIEAPPESKPSVPVREVAPAAEAEEKVTRPAVEAPPPPAAKEVKLLKLPETVTVGELASAMKRKSGELIKALFDMGIMATINQVLDSAIIKQAAEKFEFDVEVRSLDGEEIVEEEVDPSQLRLRPPVVTVMGHVDHGKTSLLDVIRRTKVVEKEFGGITQHIGAYQVETSHGKVTFLDTPGHEAFTAMRARGAQVTDIVVLVVAADDGVMPQTVEAINHAKAANVPIIVAVNKIDKPGADPERVKRQLANLGLTPEEWGGQTIYVGTSAKQGIGIDNLLELTALQAEIMELKANPKRSARGVIVEGKLDRGRGPVATVLIQQGKLIEGNIVVVGSQYGRIRAMFNDRGKKVKEAGPSDPVEILGLSGVPMAGDSMVAVDEERRARQIAMLRQDREKRKTQVTARVTLEDLHKKIKAGEVKELRLILKADVQGSVQALQEALERLSSEEVKLKVIHGSVGAITEGDIMLASASNAIVLGFNVKPDVKTAQQAQTEGIDVRTYNVIYEAINDVKAALEGMLAPEIRETPVGKAQVRALFPISKVGTVAGSYVLEGKITRSAKLRVRRGDGVIGEAQLSSLKRFKDDVREVLQGLECGIGVEGVEVKVGDIIEAYTTEEVARTL